MKFLPIIVIVAMALGIFWVISEDKKNCEKYKIELDKGREGWTVIC